MRICHGSGPQLLSGLHTAEQVHKVLHKVLPQHRLLLVWRDSHVTV
jgi:hypothetical protein